MTIVEDLKRAWSEGHRPSAAGEDLQGADLQGTDLRYADLQGANLQCANLRGSDLRYADLRDSDLQGADLRGAGLMYANLQGADLRGASLPPGSIVRALGETPSGLALIHPTPEGWQMTVGCWRGTPDSLRALISQDDDWPEARGEQVSERRPFLENALVLADWHMAKHAGYIEMLAEKWGKS